MEKIKDIWQDITKFFISKYEMIKRMLFWGWKLRNSWDFDACTIYEILYLKLTRIYNCFLDDGHCLWNDDINNKGMRELRTAIELAKRLSEDTYTYYNEKHNEKWGKPEFSFDNNVFKSTRNKVLSKEDKIQEKKEFRIALNKDNKQCINDQKELFKLLNKNISYWWD